MTTYDAALFGRSGPGGTSPSALVTRTGIVADLIRQGGGSLSFPAGKLGSPVPFTVTLARRPAGAPQDGMEWWWLPSSGWFQRKKSGGLGAIVGVVTDIAKLIPGVGSVAGIADGIIDTAGKTFGTDSSASPGLSQTGALPMAPVNASPTYAAPQAPPSPIPILVIGLVGVALLLIVKKGK